MIEVQPCSKALRAASSRVLFVDDLANRVAQALRAGLGGEGHRVLLARRAEQGDIDAEAVDAGRGQRDADLVAELGAQGADDRLDLGVIGGRQGDERKVVEAGVAEELLCAGDDFLGRALAQRAVDHPGLAEAAALGAAALDFDPGAVVDRLQVGDDRLGQDRREPLDEALDDGTEAASSVAKTSAGVPSAS